MTAKDVWLGFCASQLADSRDRHAPFLPHTLFPSPPLFLLFPSASASAPSLCLFFCSSFSLSSYPASSSPPLSPLANLFFLFQILSSLFLFLLLSLCLCLGSLLNLTPRQPWPNKLQANTLCSHHVLLYYSFVCPPISLSLSRCSSGLNLSMLFCFWSISSLLWMVSPLRYIYLSPLFQICSPLLWVCLS